MTRETITLRAARAVDLPGIERLLVENDLPTVGVRDCLDGFLVAEENSGLVGAVAVEPCGVYGLLRSAVISSPWRGRGIGRRLVERAIADARSRGTSALYLLTTTAERYFPGFGFTEIARSQVPEPIRATAEFREACPDSATVMTLQLRALP